MKAEERDDARKAGKGSRARALVKAHLGWLSGYPEASAPLRFRTLAGEEVTVGGDTLAHATRTLRELAREGPREVARVLGDDGATMEGALAALEAVKGIVHGKRALAPAPILLHGVFAARDIAMANALRERASALVPILDALVWSVSLRPKRLRALLAIADQWSDALARIDDVLTAVRLVHLAHEHGVSKVEALALALADARLTKVCTHAGTDPKAPATLPSALQKLTAWLLENGALAPTALRVFAALDVPAALDEWERYWTKYRALDSDPLRQRLAQEKPHACAGGDTFALVTWYAQADAALTKRAFEAIATLDDHGERRFFLDHIKYLTFFGQRPVLAAVTGIARYLKATRDLRTRRFLPWAEAMRGHRLGNGYAVHGIETLVRSGRPPARITAFFGLLEKLVRDRETKSVGGVTMHWLVSVADLVDDQLAVQVTQFASTDVGWIYVSRSGLERLFELGGRDLDALRAVFMAARNFNDDRTLLEPALDLLLPLVRAGQGAHACAIFSSLTNRLVDATRVLKNKKATLRVPSARETPWMDGLPPALRRAVAELASVDDNPKTTVRRLLGDTYRTRETIEVELAAAEAQAREATGLRKERLARRIENLRKRRQDPIKLTKAREANLVLKVQRATRKAIIVALEKEADATFRTFAEELLGKDVLSPALLAPDRRRYVIAIRALDPPMRALAARVLRARAGEPPWDLREAPQNRAFLEKLRKAGIDVEPWLGRSLKRVRAKNGDALVLALEDDPLRIMEMGAHFDTCLSPDGVNYFSVFSNIADVNKRVLYARDERDRIVGRVLLGLTENGAIVTFNPYAHSAAIAFTDLVSDYVHNLANAMNSVVVPRGDVPQLVAPEWYDDGPHDLTGRFQFLSAQSAFRKAVPTMDVPTFFAEVEKNLGGAPLNELTLPLLFDVNELSTNPDVVEALLGKMRDLPRLPGWAFACAARYAVSSKRPTAFPPALLARVEQHVLDRWKQASWLDGAALRLFVEIDPVRALTLLRKTRSRGIRRVEDEISQERLTLWADAFEKLGRTAQAQAARARLPKKR